MPDQQTEPCWPGIFISPTTGVLFLFWFSSGALLAFRTPAIWAVLPSSHAARFLFLAVVHFGQNSGQVHEYLPRLLLFFALTISA